MVKSHVEAIHQLEAENKTKGHNFGRKNIKRNNDKKISKKKV
jgi:hypothetical protein